MLTTIPSVIDTRLENKNVLLESVAATFVKPWVSTSFGQNSVSWSMPTPSRNTFTSRRVRIEMPILITYTGTTTGSALLQLGYDALRAYPLNKMIKSVNFTMDNQAFTSEPSAWLLGMPHYWEWDKSSNTCQFLDKYGTLSDGINTLNNPMSSYANCLDSKTPNGSFPMIVVNGATSSTITATLMEELYMPPWCRDSDSELGFTNISMMELQLQFVTNMSRVIEHALSLATFSTAPVVTLTQAPTCYMTYTSPPSDYVPHPITYKCDTIILNRTGQGTLAANTSISGISSNSLQFSCIPSSILIWVGENDNNLLYTDSDTVCNISNISFTFANQSGVLSTASEHELYKMSVENGLQDSWAEWHGVISNLGTQISTSGSFLKLMFGKDIPLLEGLYPGKAGSYNFQVTLNVKNTNQNRAITNLTIYTIHTIPGSLHAGEALNKVVGIMPQEGELIPVDYDDVKEYYAGSFKSFLGKVGHALPRINKFLQNSKIISKIGNLVAPLANAIAPGVGEMAARKVVSAISNMGYGVDDTSAMVGGMQAGKIMTPAQIRKQIKKL